jgi:hypothetical protein
MDTRLRNRRRLARFTVPAIAVALPVVAAACALGAPTRGPVSEPTRSRAFVGTFDRLLIAGFLTGHVSDRGRDLDLNRETARLLRMALTSKASLNVIDAQPIHLPQTDSATMKPEDSVFNDAAFWKRLGEEYRQPLILTGTVAFRRAGPQTAEHQIGPRTVTVSRPRFRLDMHLVFISGRTGEVLESLSLGPVAMQASEGRTSALAVYFGLMDRLAPSVVALFGQHANVRDTSR